MTIQYSTNHMGPVSLDWYRERGLTKMVSRSLESEFLAKKLDKQVGDEYEFETITEHWAGGRIDIYGLDEHEYYCGRSEYALPIMDGTSWDLFSDWLDEYETIELKTFDQLLSAFEADTDHVIRWAHEEFTDND